MNNKQAIEVIRTVAPWLAFVLEMRLKKMDKPAKNLLHTWIGHVLNADGMLTEAGADALETIEVELVYAVHGLEIVVRDNGDVKIVPTAEEVILFTVGDPEDYEGALPAINFDVGRLRRSLKGTMPGLVQVEHETPKGIVEVPVLLWC